MKNLAIFILTVFVFSAYGQGNSTSGFKKIQVGINISPDLCFRILKNNDGSSSSENIVHFRDSIETIKMGYTTGLNVCFNLNKTIGLETGIQYSDKGYQTIVTEFVSIQPDPNIPEKVRFIYHFHYIDIPLKANFTLGNKKVRFLTSIGIVSNIFIKETQTEILYFTDRKEKEKDPTGYEYNKINLSAAISAGIDYKINSRMNLRIEPIFRYGILKINDTPVTGYLWNAGLNIGYYFGI